MTAINTDTSLMVASSGGVLLSASNELLNAMPQSGGVIALLTMVVQMIIMFRQSRTERKKAEQLKKDEVKNIVKELLDSKENGKD